YILMGRSFAVWEWGCSNVTFTNMLGAMSFSTLKEYFVCPCRVSIHHVFNTLLPFSMLTNARPPLLLGMVKVTSSPTLNFSLLAVKESIDASVGLFCSSLCAHPGQSMYSVCPVV